MRLFSRNKEAVEAVSVDDVPFESLRRSPRSPGNTRKKRAAPEPDFDTAAPLDPAETSKTRARRRLIGAVALALAAIVFVPMLFDRAPVAPADDIGLQIPDRETPFEGRRGVPDAGKAPLRPSSDLPAPSTAAPVADAPAPVEAAPVVAAVPDKPVETSVRPAAKQPDPVVAKAADKPATKVAEKTIEKPSEKVADKKTAAPADDPRAIAALEGKVDAPAATDAAAGRSYAVQIAAFSSADKARGLRDQLTANGLKSYTESVSTSQGLRTRVRLGPFASHDAADKAKQKLRTMKLDGSVVPL